MKTSFILRGGDILDIGADYFRIRMAGGGYVITDSVGIMHSHEGPMDKVGKAFDYILGNLSRLGELALLEPVDLRHLNWNVPRVTFGGKLPTAFDKGKDYLCPSYQVGVGTCGYGTVTEALVSNLLDTMGVEHVHYDVIPAIVMLKGVEYTMPVSVFEDYNPNGKTSVTFEQYFDHRPTDEELQDAGMLDYVYRMRVVDFLIGNTGRHGDDVEIVGGVPAPLHAHGHSLLMHEDPILWSHWSRDFVRTCCGSMSLKQNLETVPERILREFKKPNLRLCRSPYWDDYHTQALKVMLAERWDYIKERML